MSGICAVWRRDHPEGVGEVLASATRGLSLAKSEQPALELEPGAGVAVSARFETQQIYRNSRVLLACDADLLNETELNGLIRDREQLPEGPSTAALLCALYERFGSDFVEKLRGAFSVVLWDCWERKLWLRGTCPRRPGSHRPRPC